MQRPTSALALCVLLAIPGGGACAAEAPAAPPTATIRVPIGDARLDFEEDFGLDEKLGGAFRLGVRSGAENCYVDALAHNAGETGEIAFAVKPPPGEGKFLVDLEARAAIGPDLVACVRKVFGSFYHYADKEPFDAVHGTLRFQPSWITAPALPAAAEVRAVIERSYAEDGVVRVVGLRETWNSQWVDGSSAVFHDYRYDVELEFTTDGYEADCQHNGRYKVFSRRPFDWSRWAGHSCESRRHRKGDPAKDDATVSYRLSIYPAVAASWELRSQPGVIRGTTSLP